VRSSINYRIKETREFRDEVLSSFSGYGFWCQLYNRPFCLLWHSVEGERYHSHGHYYRHATVILAIGCSIRHRRPFYNFFLKSILIFKTLLEHRSIEIFRWRSQSPLWSIWPSTAVHKLSSQPEGVLRRRSKDGVRYYVSYIQRILQRSQCSNVDTSDFLWLVSNSTGTPAFIFCCETKSWNDPVGMCAHWIPRRRPFLEYDVFYLPKTTNEVVFDLLILLNGIFISRLRPIFGLISNDPFVHWDWPGTVTFVWLGALLSTIAFREMYFLLHYLDWISWNSFSARPETQIWYSQFFRQNVSTLPEPRS